MIDRLFPYQEEGAAFLLERDAALLADAPGLGKTLQVIAASQYRQDTLYLCPASLCENVRREFAKCGREGVVVRGTKGEIPGGGLVIMSYDTVCMDGVFEQLDHKWDLLVCDESHLLKSPKAKRSQFVLGNSRRRGLAQRADKVILLTGTPVMSHVGELWTALQALRPDFVDGMSYKNFIYHYCQTREHPQFGTQVIGHKGAKVRQLRERLEGDFMLRRLKSDVLPDLPPIRVEPLYISVGVSTSDPLEQALLDLAENGNVSDMVEEQLDPDLYDVEEYISTIRRETEVMKVREIARIIEADLDGGMEKILVFAHHQETLDALDDALDRGQVRLDGRTTPEQRQRAIDQFHEGDARVFLGQTQAAGVGLTLHAGGKCSDVLFCSLDFTPANNQQAMMRVHRIGQPNACLVRYAVASGTYDERVNHILASKTRRILDVVEEENEQSPNA